MEKWKPILNFENSYEVSNQGRVRSINKLVNTGIRHSDQRVRKGRMLKLNLKSTGYLSVDLSDSNIKKTINVHRLVATTFVANPQGKPQVNHINGNKVDNRATNLEWVTASENHQHRYKHLGHIGKRKQVLCVETKQVHGSSKQAAEWLNKEKYQYSRQVTTLARKIRKCCVKELETAHGYTWKYVVSKFND